MKKQTLIVISTAALIFVILTAISIAIIDQKLLDELAENQEKLRVLQEEYDALRQDYIALQQNYTNQQVQFMDVFVPILETELGTIVLTDNKSGTNYGKNYLWVTGEVYNRGLGVAFNTVLQVKLFSQNSSVPTVCDYSLGDIDIHNYKQIRRPFYSNMDIDHWEINVECSISK